MVDAAIVAAKVGAIRDAVVRVRHVLPREAGTFEADRTVREVVVLNLFVALQETVSLATHWLADAGLDVPASYSRDLPRPRRARPDPARPRGASRVRRGLPEPDRSPVRGSRSGPRPCHGVARAR